MLDDKTTYAPLTLFEYDHAPGRYCLMMADADWDDAVDVFDECGAYGNGYGWEGVARQAMRAHLADVANTVDFDSEGGTFVAHSFDVDALRQLGAVLQKATLDHRLLAELIRGAEPGWLD
ncbi:Imm51 family immunity protein [Micromonospora sp. bgisy143]|uniref:Imm51 family immunity protein n=1 Tax=Micromonospora sp. bgisy143 TaxID=3413790 RepID=UPI003EBA031B